MTKILNYNKNYLIAEDIACKDCNGKIFEKYDALLVPKKIMRTRSPSGKRFTHKAECKNIYEIVDMFEGTKKFLPSMALTFAITKACLENRNKHKNISKILEEYSYNRSTYGMFLQNTFFETNNNCKIIHYPNKEDLLNGWNCVIVNPEFYGNNERKKLLNSKMNQINLRVELQGHGIGKFESGKSFTISSLIKDESYKKHITDLLGDEDFLGTLENLSKFLRREDIRCTTYKTDTYFDGRESFTGIGFGTGLNRFDPLEIKMMGYSDLSTTFRYFEKI